MGHDVSVYLGRQSGGRAPDWKNAFCVHIVHFEPEVVCFLLQECSKLQCLGQKLRGKASTSLFWWGTSLPLSTLVDTDIIHMMQVIKSWTVGRPGNKANDWPHGCRLWLLTCAPLHTNTIKRSPYYINILNPHHSINYQIVIFLLWKSYHCYSFLFAGRRRRMERSVGCSWGTTGPTGIMDSLT